MQPVRVTSHYGKQVRVTHEFCLGPRQQLRGEVESLAGSALGFAPQRRRSTPS